MPAIVEAIAQVVLIILQELRRWLDSAQRVREENERGELVKDPGTWFDSHFGVPSELPRKDDK